MNRFKRLYIAAFSLGAALVAFNAVYFGVTSFAAELEKESQGKSSEKEDGMTVMDQLNSAKGKSQTGKHNFPATAYEYAKMVEPDLGVPPRIDLGEGVEVLTYVDGVPARGRFDRGDCDNPTQLGSDCISGSSLQRFEGRTADGEPLPDVVWVSFGRHDGSGGGSVQMIGYHKETGATAFFESSDRIRPWTHSDPETHRLLGVMPWIDEPEEFNKAFRVPGTVQCVLCHQNEPFIHSSYVDAAKMPGTDEPVIPEIVARNRNMKFDLPYYVIGGEEWDMRTIHIEGNGCLNCHRIGMNTLELYLGNDVAAWHPNDHMPPNDPGSLAEDFQELMDCWTNGPENTPGCDWVVPPAGDALGRVVGDDYPYIESFNTPGNIFGGGKYFGMSKEDFIDATRSKGLTEEEISEMIEFIESGADKPDDAS